MSNQQTIIYHYLQDRKIELMGIKKFNKCFNGSFALQQPQSNTRIIRTGGTVSGKAEGYTKQRAQFCDGNGIWHTVYTKQGDYSNGKLINLIHMEFYGEVEGNQFVPYPRKKMKLDSF